MRVIDCHLHLSTEEEIQIFAKKYGIDPSEKGLLKEMNKNNIVKAIILTTNLKERTPLQFELLKRMAKNKRFAGVAGINPYKINAIALKRLEFGLSKGIIKGFKVYLGYYHFYPFDKKYNKIYELAENYDCPVIFHTGDTFGESHLLKYSHPLNIDEVAVKFPKTKFVIAHMGCPWFIDAAEVAYKNSNVYLDLSGLQIGRIKKLPRLEEQIKYAMEYVGFEKAMYGSDWPLIKMKPYINFIKRLIPQKNRKQVFYSNAKELFGI